jgi:serine/threonine protein kinase
VKTRYWSYDAPDIVAVSQRRQTNPGQEFPQAKRDRDAGVSQRNILRGLIEFADVRSAGQPGLRVAADTPDLSGTGYVLLDKLGAGGMGGVFRVEDTALGRQVALKMLGIADSSGEFGARLLREAKIIAPLEHPGIVPVHDVGTLPDGRVFYTMNLVQGRRLDQRRDELGGVPERLRTFQKICEAVSFTHAHQGLHRDLKPQNNMVVQFGEVLVMDWGLATVLNAEISAEPNPPRKIRLQQEDSHSDADTTDADTAHGAVLGTPGYMAPEQARGDGDAVGQRADVYSLGAVLTFLLDDCGRVPKVLFAIGSKTMAEDAQQRYGSVEELANDIAHYLDGLPVSAYPEAMARLWRWAVKNSAWILLIVAYLVMRALFILWRGR